MRISYSLLILIALGSLMACNKKDSQSVNRPTQIENLDIIWRVPLVPDPNYYYTISMNPILFEDVVVFNTVHNMHGAQAPVLFMDTANGAIKETWDDYFDGNAYYYGEMAITDEFHLFLGSQWSVDCINLKTRETQWHGPVGPNTPYIYQNKGFLYRAVQFNRERSSAIMRTPVDRMAWDTVYSFTKTDKFRPSFDSFGFGQLPSGDEVIVWKNRNWGANGYPTDVFAYNLTADTLMWRNQDLELNSRVNPLQVVDNRVIGNVQSTVFAIDLETGAMLWTKNLGKALGPNAEFSSLEAIYVGETSVVVKGTGPKLVGVLKKSGDINWVQENNGANLENRFTYFEGKLFFPAEGLRIVDAQTGEALISEHLSREIEDIKSKIVIDPSRRCMYFHNAREAFCVRIPKGI